MPIQLGRTRGEVYHTFCVLILKSPLTYALVQKPQDSKQSRGGDEECYNPCTKTC